MNAKHISGNERGNLSDEPVKPTQQRQTDVFKCFCDWILDADLPFPTIKNRFFKDMIACSNLNLMVPFRTPMGREVNDMRTKGKIKIHDTLSHILGMVSLTNGVWLLRV